MSIRINPAAPESEAMDIIEAELEWKYDLETKCYIETNSHFRDYIIDLDCVLWIYYRNGDKPIKTRKCVDDEHAMAMAAAHECKCISDARWGQTWRGVYVNERAEPYD